MSLSFLKSLSTRLHSAFRPRTQGTRVTQRGCGLSAQYRLVTLLAILAVLAHSAMAQSPSLTEQVQKLQELVTNLQARVTAIEEENRNLRTTSAPPDGGGHYDAAALESAVARSRSLEAAQPQEATKASSARKNPAAVRLPGILPGGATINYYLDGYYEYNFNDPVGRVNDLRVYDVLSNTFSLSQADLIFALDPDVSAHRRYGFRVDLQFGQATETLQGNPANEPRPDIYRNIFQAYGSYVVPVGHGLNVDIGKWASSLGIEGNYAKDQMNYTRSWYYYFLPFYHEGLRSSYKRYDKVAVN